MLKFYICKVCGNLVMKVEDGGNTPFCCGKQMVELVPASTDGAKEKHVPVKRYSDMGCGQTAVWVAVGSEAHPMEKYHYIQWIALETERGVQIRKLDPGDQPQVMFLLNGDDTVLHAYAYCNLHGLWIT